MSIGPATLAYRDCYSNCRSGGGDIASCMDQCRALMNGDTSVSVPGPNGNTSCTDVWSCFSADLPGTVRDVTGGLWNVAQAGVKTLTPIVQGIGAVVIGLAILALVITLRK
jgi:hypothetical protein